MNIEYKCFYRFNDRDKWKHCFFDAPNDLAAISKAGEQMEEWDVKSFGVERITRERIL